MKFATLVIFACLKCVTVKSQGSLRVEDKSSNKAATTAELTQVYDPEINDDAIVNADEREEADWGLKSSVREAMVCTPLWYINCDGVCVMSCEVDIGGSCGGLAKPWDTLCVTKAECCEMKLTSIGVPFYEEGIFRDSCLASCHSPTPALDNTSSKNPSTNPSSNPSEITITAIQESTDPSSNPSSLPSSNPSVDVTPALVTLSGCTNPLFPTNEEFKKAVKEYISQECSTNSGCAIGQTYGYPIGKWLTTCITDMSSLFAGTEEFQVLFDEDISEWDVSSVLSMELMFYYASSFNQPLSNWDVSLVTNFWGMFDEASSFNQPLNNWDVSSAIWLGMMFSGASSFDQPLNDWDVSSGIATIKMFNGASKFNQPLSNWSVSSVDHFWGMFDEASSFNQPLNNWDVSSATHLGTMFSGASSFDQPLNDWDVSSAFHFNRMFAHASSFDQPLQAWNVSASADMFNMFNGASSFNQTLCVWAATSTTFPYGQTSSGMFTGTSCTNKADPTSAARGPLCADC